MLDIVIPVYNEAENIENLFNEIQKDIGIDKTIYIIYDFDDDNTLPIVKKIKDSYSFDIELIKNSNGKGAINAIKTGLKNVPHDKVLVVMADCSDRLDIVDEMVILMENDCLDVVCGSRYMRGGKHHGGPFLKSLFSRTAGVSLHWITKIPTHDVTNSFKLYSKRLLQQIEFESIGGFEIGMEITVKAFTGGFRIGEVPSEWFDRVNGQSNFHMWKWMPYYLKWYFYCLKNHKGKSKK